MGVRGENSSPGENYCHTKKLGEGRGGDRKYLKEEPNKDNHSCSENKLK